MRPVNYYSNTDLTNYSILLRATVELICILGTVPIIKVSRYYGTPYYDCMISFYGACKKHAFVLSVLYQSDCNAVFTKFNCSCSRSAYRSSYVNYQSLLPLVKVAVKCWNGLSDRQYAKQSDIQV